MLRWPGHVPPGRVFNGIQGYKMNGTTYKVHLDGYNNLDRWTGKTEKSARHEILDYDETDLMAVDGWKMHIGVKTRDNWFDPKSYPSVPYVVNLLMDPMEKMTPQLRRIRLHQRTVPRRTSQELQDFLLVRAQTPSA
jgi:arylsulfatase